MKKIAIIGIKGKMGSLIFEKLKTDYEVCGIDIGDNLSKAFDCDLVIDFSTGTNSAVTAIWCKMRKIPLIIGATGQTEEENKLITDCSKEIAILKAGNFSIGIMLIRKMLNQIEKEQIDSISIFEKHHKYKKDVPSGTAIEIRDYCEKLFGKQIEICAIRGGEEIGTHEISVYLDGEVIKISHQAFSRRVFAQGVCLAVKFMLENKSTGMIKLDKILKI